MLVNFSDLFLKSKGEPIKYGKKTLLLIDHFPVENEFQIMLKLISFLGRWSAARTRSNDYHSRKNKR